MGYYTLFVIEAGSHTELVKEALSEISGYDFDDTCKWYDHKDHIKLVSKQFSTTLITVTGYGEERGDIWRAYAINGDYQRVVADITFPPCTLELPKTHYRTVCVSVFGIDIPVEVECVETTSEDEAYNMACDILRRQI